MMMSKTCVYDLSLQECWRLSDEYSDLEGVLACSCVESRGGTWYLELIHRSSVDIHGLFGSKYCLETCELPEQDWLKLSYQGFKAMHIGRFCVFGAHLVGDNAFRDSFGSVCIELDAATAFGTGGHATTHMCLEAVWRYLPSDPPSKVLDLGCGAGLLAIAAAKLGCKNVYAYDNDPEAVRVCRENAERNRVRVHVALNAAHEYSFQQYDLVVANILEDAVIEMSDSVFASLKSNGVLILSGFLDEKNVLRCYESKFSCDVIECMHLDSWSALVLRKR